MHSCPRGGIHVACMYIDDDDILRDTESSEDSADEVQSHPEK
jgi:hypothetical protein